MKIWPAVNFNRVQVSWKKVKLQDFGSRQIKQFPIDCTLLLKTIFQKNILWFFFLSPQRAEQKFSKFFEKKMKIQDFGSRQIRKFPIDCTPLLKTIFQKNILWFFFLSPQRVTQKFSKFFWKKWKCKILDLGESNNFLSIAPHFFFRKKSSLRAFFGALRGP